MDDYWGPFTQQPNILIVMTDQQRSTQHYPDFWVQDNLPNLYSLMQSGVTFNNAMTNSTACSPSRATLFTGTYPILNGVTSVNETLDTVGQPITLPSGITLPLATLGQIMLDGSLVPAGVEYQIAYKGKWHLDTTYQYNLSPDEQADSSNWDNLASDDQDMKATYGFPGWASQDFGTKVGPQYLNNLGGSGNDPDNIVGGNDQRVINGTSYPDGTGGTVPVQNAVNFLQDFTPNEGGTDPFLLIVSLANPHDIWVSPKLYKQAGYEADSDGKYPWQKAPFTDIQLSDTDSYNLTSDQKDEKPTIQGDFYSGYDDDDATDYIRFYAYLETLSDALLGDVTATLQSNSNNLLDSTLIVRLADHGEMGMAQGGMYEKENQAYNETLLVPMIFSNPGLTQGATSNQLAGLIDIIPTIAEICGIDVNLLQSTYAQQGASVASTILAPDNDATDQQFLFATDDNSGKGYDCHIRCLIDADQYNAKYSVYYDATDSSSNANGTASDFQYEMYYFSADPDDRNSEETNLLPVDGTGTVSLDIQTLWNNMHTELTAKLSGYGLKPDNWQDTPPQLD